MELKEFIKNVLSDLTLGIKEMNDDSPYAIHFDKNEQVRTVEFDIAVTTENSSSKSGGAGIKVLQFIEGGAKAEGSSKDSTVSRIKFGVYINSLTKEEVVSRKTMSTYRRNQEF